MIVLVALACSVPTFAGPSEELLRRLNFDLFLRLQHYGELTNEEKLKTQVDYKSLEEFLVRPALPLIGSVNFWEIYAPRFPEILFTDQAVLHKNGQLKTLGGFLEEAIREKHSDLNWIFDEASFRSNANWAGLEREIEKTRNPILAVDIDNVVLSTRAWSASVLKDFDRRHRTFFFRDLRLGPVGEPRDFLSRYLFPGVESYRTLSNLVERMAHHHEQLYNSPRLSRDTPPLNENVRKLKMLRAKYRKLRLVFITARPPSMHEVTRSALTRVGFAHDLVQPWSLQMVGEEREGLPADPQVIARAKALNAKKVAKEIDGQMVGFLDDSRANVLQMEAEFEGLVGLWMVSAPHMLGEQTFALRTNELPLGYHAADLARCGYAYSRFSAF